MARNYRSSGGNRRRKPFLLSWWVLGPLALLLVGATIAFIAFEILRHKYEERAGEFELAEVEKMEAASLIFDRDGNEIAKIFLHNRNPIPYNMMPDMLVKAVIAAEDNRFYQHDGVDYMGILRAALANYRAGRIRQGASTVTQQLARNSFELRERTYERKLVEMFLAHRIEKNFSKDKIMEMYLNRVYFGSGLYGAESAAMGYFGKPAKDLSIGESALLAGLLRSPQALSPWNNREGAINVRNLVLGQMRSQGFITRQQFNEARDTPLVVRRRMNPHKVSYAIDFVRQQVISALGFEQAMNGGLRIHTTLDSGLQRAAEISLRNKLEEVESYKGYNNPTFGQYRSEVTEKEEAINRGNMHIKLPTPKYLQGAVLTVDNASGGIRVMIGGRDFRHSEYNRALQARRPMGTTFTPIVAAAAFENGFFPGTMVDDACIDNRYVMVGGATGILGEWGVERVENEYEGSMPVREALAKGKNAAIVRLGFLLGLEPVRQVAKKLGIESPLREYSNAFLGSSEATLEEMTLAFSAFPGLGWRPKQFHIIERIEDSAGRLLFKVQPERVPTISDTAAYQTHTTLVDALRWGTGAQAYQKFGLMDGELAAKTGTAYNFTDTYCLGYSSSLTTGVWIGYDLPRRIFRGAFGNDLALPVWVDIMNAAGTRYPVQSIQRPETLKEVDLCRSTGLKATAACPVQQVAHFGRDPFPMRQVYREVATEEQMPQDACDLHGGGVRSFVRHYSEEDWPRAASAVDLTLIRPIGVNSPTLVGVNDIYHAVQPGVARLEDGSIPVARAIPVEDAIQSTETEDGIPVAKAIPVDSEAVPTVGGGEPEVRRAEAAGALSPLDGQLIDLPAPPPINF